ncbi:MAG: hypothetical protein JJU48_10040 [Methylophaga sp.]|nr:hypothetical protein [Methylophaga sp.]
MKSIALSLAISMTMLLVSISILYNPPTPMLNYWLANNISENANFTTVNNNAIPTHSSCHPERPVAVMLDAHSTQSSMFYLGEADSAKASELLKAADCTHTDVHKPSSRLLKYDAMPTMQDGKYILVFHPKLEEVLVFEMSAQQQITLTEPAPPGAIIEM